MHVHSNFKTFTLEKKSQGVWMFMDICLTKIKQILEEIYDHDKVFVLCAMRFSSQLRSEDEALPGNSLRIQAASAWLRFPAGELFQTTACRVIFL